MNLGVAVLQMPHGHEDVDPKLPDGLTFKRDQESHLFQCRVFQLLNVGVKILKKQPL